VLPAPGGPIISEIGPPEVAAVGGLKWLLSWVVLPVPNSTQ
jgi:hypothetical protein